MRWVPAGFIIFLTGLTVLGAHLRAFEMPPFPRCNYVLAEMDLPPADVIVFGGSRVARGLDPDIIEQTVLATGESATVDRLSLTFASFPQFYPIVKTYIEERGAPEIAYLQLTYIFRPEQLSYQDLPVNSLRNMGFGTPSEMIDVQLGTPLNDTGTKVPRQFHDRYRTLPSAFLKKIEMSIFSALRYVPKRMRGAMPDCSGDFLRANGHRQTASGLTPDDGLNFVAPDPENLEKWSATAAEFLPLSPSADWRQGETAQLHKLVDLLEEAQTEVIFVVLPAIRQTTLSEEAKAELRTMFPHIEIFFPMDSYDGELEEQISISFEDTHHANPFGAYYFSKALGEDLARRLAAQ